MGLVEAHGGWGYCGDGVGNMEFLDEGRCGIGVWVIIAGNEGRKYQRMESDSILSNRIMHQIGKFYMRFYMLTMEKRNKTGKQLVRGRSMT